MGEEGRDTGTCAAARQLVRSAEIEAVATVAKKPVKTNPMMRWKSMAIVILTLLSSRTAYGSSGMQE